MKDILLIALPLIFAAAAFDGESAAAVADGDDELKLADAAACGDDVDSGAAQPQGKRAKVEGHGAPAETDAISDADMQSDVA